MRTITPSFVVLTVASLVALACGSSSQDSPGPGGTSAGGNSSGGNSSAGNNSGGTSAGGASAGGTSSGGTSAAGAPTGTAPTIAGCKIFPDDNPWNQDVSKLPLHPMAATYASGMNPSKGVHPDWGNWSTDHYGIPFVTGTGAPPQKMTWTETWGAEESDERPCAGGGGDFCYPIPLTAPIEGGPGADTDSDRHVLYLDTAGAPSNCTLFELYNAQNPGASGWTAINGAIFPLGTNALRTEGWTSADAAGLPILPGLVRYDEVMSGEIRHAIRFTMNDTTKGYVHPATHHAGKSNPSYPPMGLRMRLKASFDTSAFKGPSLVIATAMKKYGIILADNGSDWFISGESNDGWEPLMDDLLGDLGKIKGKDFEAVDTGPTLQ